MNSTVIESPYETHEIKTLKKPSLFLAGGITNCPNWQADAIEELKEENIIIYNPRRENFPMDDPDAANIQIMWEYDHLEGVNVICFWFCKETLNPIVLYELGRWGNSSSRKIVIGMDPEYKRKQDVIIQTKLSRPDIVVHQSWKKFIKGIKKEFREKK